MPHSNFPALLVLAFLVSPLFAQAQEAARENESDRVRNVVVPDDETSFVVSDSLTGFSIHDYVFVRDSVGTLTVRLETQGVATVMVIHNDGFSPDNFKSVGTWRNRRENADGVVWTGELPDPGSYRVRVIHSGPAANSGYVSYYELSLNISELPQPETNDTDLTDSKVNLFAELIWANNFQNVPVFVGYSWEWRGAGTDAEMSPLTAALGYSLFIDRIEWGRLRDYQKDRLVTSAYEGIRSNYRRLFPEARYRPFLRFEIREPGIGQVVVAQHNGSDYYLR